MRGRYFISSFLLHICIQGVLNHWRNEKRWTGFDIWIEMNSSNLSSETLRFQDVPLNECTSKPQSEASLHQGVPKSNFVNNFSLICSSPIQSFRVRYRFWSTLYNHIYFNVTNLVRLMLNASLLPGTNFWAVCGPHNNISMIIIKFIS